MGTEIIPHFPILSLVAFLPLLGGLLLLVVPRENEGLLKGMALGIATLTFVASIGILVKFDSNIGGLQAHLADRHSWLPSLNATYFLAIDGISLWLVMLTTFLGPLVLISSWTSIKTRVKEFLIAMLVLETGILGAFLSMDLFLFYIFWEMMLVPMYLLIGIWGGKNRIYATVKFFLFTMFGSVLMLVGIIFLYIKAGSSTFAINEIIGKVELTHTEQIWLFLAFGLAFAIKVPVFPFHTWLPDAHTEAPTAGSVILAGVLLKLGTYGFVRFGMPLFPEAMRTLAPLVMLLSVIGIVYGAFISYVQKDVKRLVAYSSVSHLGFVMVGIAAMTEESVTGAVLQMVNHGICTGGLFIAIGFLYEQRHTRQIEDFGGIAKQVPLFAVFFMILTLGSIGLPGTNGFIGEFLIISGTIQSGFSPKPLVNIREWNDHHIPWALGNYFSSGGMSVFFFKVTSIVMGCLAALGVVMGAVYMLSMYRRVFFGPLTSEKNKQIKDLGARDLVVAIPLVLLIFGIGLFPNVFIKPMRKSIQQLTHYVRPELTGKEVSPRVLNDRLCESRSCPRAKGCNPVAPTAKDCVKGRLVGKTQRYPAVSIRQLLLEDARLKKTLRLPLQLERSRTTRLKRKVTRTKKGGRG